MSITVFHDAMTRDARKISPTSFSQQGLWFLDKLVPNSSINTLSAIVAINKSLSPTALEQSLARLVQRHEILRTTFAMQDGQVVQLIADYLPVPLSMVDLHELPEDQQQTKMNTLADAQAGLPFDLQQGPLLRCTLVQLAPERFRLLLTLHRAICDERSVGLLIRELASLSASGKDEQPSSLPPPAAQYADLAQAQREGLAGQGFASSLDYWKQQLAGAPDALELPIDHARPAVASWQGSTHRAMLPAELSQALHSLSEQLAVSFDVILVAALETLLYRYTGQEDLLLGTVAPARRLAGSEDLIGPCENLLPLRADLAGNPRFSDLLKRVHASLEEGRVHEALPFEALLKQIYPTRTLNHNPLLQVLLRLPQLQTTLPAGWTLEQLELGKEAAQFDVTLHMQEGPQGLSADFIYSRDVFDEATIVRMAGHWQSLLEGIVADPEQNLSHLPLLTEQERRQLLVEWNDLQRPYPVDQCLPQLFEAQVARNPEAIAVACQGVELSYRQLNQQANQLAHYLRDCGVGSETLVALLGDRGIPLLVAILAVFKAGGAYLPLDPRHPEARLRWEIEQSQSRVVLSEATFVGMISQALADMPDEARPRCVNLEDVLQSAQSPENLGPCGNPQDMAYVIYTSGSTGRPKGAMVEQRGMINHLYAKIEALDLKAKDIVAQTAPQCFDISVWQFLAILLVGGRVQIYPDAVASDPVELLRQVEQHQVSILETVPSLLGAMLDTYESVGVEALPLHALRWLIPTGEALPVELCRRWLKRYPHIPMLNAYGPTECSDDVTHYAISQPPPEETSSISIGSAIPNMQLYVLDQHLQPLPIGVSGELHVGGVGVGRGYLGDEQRTARAFVRDPFSRREGARLYKTGDRARYLPDGNLEFLGRLDFQVKLRGLRIELGEIESVLSLHPAVHQAVVIAREDTPGDKRLVAYVVLHPEHKATVEELKSQAMLQMPAYMVPSAFMQLDRLPVTPNGKLDRKALPAPSWAGDSYVAPVSPLERRMAELWQELLGVQRVGLRDDFFELGGDSLLAVQFFARMEEIYGRKLAISTLFAGSTIEYLARALQEEAQKDSRVPLVTVRASGTRRPFFLLPGEWSGQDSSGQELARYLSPQQPLYLLEAYRLDGLVLPPALPVMAAEYRKILRSVQPEGPYLLGGYGNAGPMVYELARQLQAQGQTVDLLLLLDPDVPGHHKVIRSAISRFAQMRNIKQEKQFDLFMRLRHIYKYTKFSHYRRLKNSAFLKTVEAEQNLARPEAAGSTPLSLKLKALVPDLETLRQDHLNLYDWPMSDYTLGLYAGKITFFWTSEEPRRAAGWQKVMRAKERDVEIHMLPGNHVTCRTEYLPVLAEYLRRCLYKAQNTAMDAKR
ncbi:non-ribosomal peptide synthetase [Ktedonosporobacter rubrisoli]|nr:non-ribosomal peptide synthetase [Ktedonosporobacter rubrisoli]